MYWLVLACVACIASYRSLDNWGDSLHGLAEAQDSVETLREPFLPADLEKEEADRSLV